MMKLCIHYLMKIVVSNKNLTGGGRRRDSVLITQFNKILGLEWNLYFLIDFSVLNPTAELLLCQNFELSYFGNSRNAILTIFRPL